MWKIHKTRIIPISFLNEKFAFLRKPKNGIKLGIICCLILFLINTYLFAAKRTDQQEYNTNRVGQIANIGENKFGPAAYSTNLLLSTTWSELVLFSTWTVKYGKEEVHKRVVDNWANISQSVKPLIFTADEKIIKQVCSSKWIVYQQEVEVDCGNIPTLRGMMKESIAMCNSKLYGFANSDLVFGEDFWKSIKVILADETMLRKPLLILAQRLNVNFNASLDYSMGGIVALASSGKYPVEGSSDIFITNKLFPWDGVMKLVVGRMGVGMWLVAYARAKHVTIIDITNTSTILHLTTVMGNHESGYSNNYSFNIDAMAREGFNWNHYAIGSLVCAGFATSYTNDSRITIIKKNTIKARCLGEPMKDFARKISSSLLIGNSKTKH